LKPIIKFIPLFFFFLSLLQISALPGNRLKVIEGSALDDYFDIPSPELFYEKMDAQTTFAVSDYRIAAVYHSVHHTQNLVYLVLYKTAGQKFHFLARSSLIKDQPGNCCSKIHILMLKNKKRAIELEFKLIPSHIEKSYRAVFYKKNKKFLIEEI